MISRLALGAAAGAALLAFNCALPPASVNEQAGGGGGGSGGGPSGGSGGGSGLTCGITFDTYPPCEACAETHCCNELYACRPGTDCYQLAQCLTDNGCPNSGDPQACAEAFCSAFLAGVDAGNALFNCVCNTCSDCAATCSI